VEWAGLEVGNIWNSNVLAGQGQDLEWCIEKTSQDPSQSYQKLFGALLYNRTNTQRKQEIIQHQTTSLDIQVFCLLWIISRAPMNYPNPNPWSYTSETTLVSTWPRCIRRPRNTSDHYLYLCKLYHHHFNSFLNYLLIFKHLSLSIIPIPFYILEFEILFLTSTLVNPSCDKWYPSQWYQLCELAVKNDNHLDLCSS